MGGEGLAGHVCTLVIVIHNNKIRRERISTAFGDDTPDLANHGPAINVFLGALGDADTPEAEPQPDYLLPAHMTLRSPICSRRRCLVAIRVVGRMRPPPSVELRLRLAGIA